MEALKKLRKDRKLNQSELANYLGISVSAYGNYELGQREPNIETLDKLAEFYDVSVDYLIGRTGVKESFEWSDEEKALGVGNHPTRLSDKEWEWLELRSEVIESCGEEYYASLVKMLRTLIESNKKK